MLSDLNDRIGAQNSQLQDRQTMNDNENRQSAPSARAPKNPPAKNQTTSGSTPRDQAASNEEQRQAFVRALADIRSDMVKIAEGNLKAMSDDDKQALSVQALIHNRTAQLQEKIDDYVGQFQNLKRELKAHKNLAQQHVDSATDARDKLG
jgi:hypothetical protein